MSNLIIGYGIVGQNLRKELNAVEFDIYDKYKGIDERKEKIYDVAFICVDTPYTEDSINDTQEVYNALIDNEADLFIIKSAVLPETTEMLARKTGKQIVNSPEYYGSTQHANNYDFNFTILGGDIENTTKAQQFLQYCYDANHRFYHVSYLEAEIVKYMENSWLGYKVSFMHQFSDICKSHGVPYEKVRELFILDPRVNPSHTFVYDEHPYWSSHCLDKDIPAIAGSENAPLLKELIKFNTKRKG